MQMLTGFLSQTLLFLENEQVVLHCPCVSAMVTWILVQEFLPKGKEMRVLLQKEALAS